MKSKSDIGIIIRNSRRALGLTQEQLAEQADIDAKNLSKIENGIHIPTYATMKKIYNILHFDVEYSAFETNDERITTSKNPIFAKTLAILKSAENDEELENYYEILKLAQKIMKHKSKI